MFEEPFKPSRLNVYTPFTTTPYGVQAICLPNRCSPTCIIADDRGRLLEGVCRGPSSPWGDYSPNTFDEICGCCCVQELRHPEKADCPKKYFMVGENEQKCGTRNRLTVPCKKPVKKCSAPPPPCKLTPLEKKLQEQQVKKQKREQKKIAQVQKKCEIDEKFRCRREELFQKSLIPPKPCDWKTIRKNSCDPDTAKKKAGTRPPCPPLDSCCSNFAPGQYVTCPCLNQENYIRRY